LSFAQHLSLHTTCHCEEQSDEAISGPVRIDRGIAASLRSSQ
jgi:hypothetical protein